MVEVNISNDLKADAGPAHSLKGLGNYGKAQCKWPQQLSRQELQCKTYEECQRLIEAAAESVACRKSALPRVLAKSSFGTVPRRTKGDLICNPACDEEFKALL